MNTKLASWVAIDAEGFPIGFASVDAYSRDQAQAEFPGARIEYAEGDERSAWLRRHAGLAS